MASRALKPSRLVAAWRCRDGDPSGRLLFVRVRCRGRTPGPGERGAGALRGFDPVKCPSSRDPSAGSATRSRKAAVRPSVTGRRIDALRGGTRTQKSLGEGVIASPCAGRAIVIGRRFLARRRPQGARIWAGTATETVWESMTYVVNEFCIKCKYTDCVEVCPVDCFYEGENMLVIHPDECIDCGVCEPECPVDAIKPDTEPGLERWLELNRQIPETWPNITTQEARAPRCRRFCVRARQIREIFLARAGRRRLSPSRGKR